MRRLLAAVAVAVLSLVLLSACGSSDSSTADGGSSTSPKVITITFKGSSVTPNGERFDVAKGQPIDLKVTADKPGEIHVHSSPEKELEYSAGTTELTVGPFDKPGIIEVESHALEKTIVQLQVQ